MREHGGHIRTWNHWSAFPRAGRALCNRHFTEVGAEAWSGASLTWLGGRLITAGLIVTLVIGYYFR